MALVLWCSMFILNLIGFNFHVNILLNTFWVYPSMFITISIIESLFNVKYLKKFVLLDKIIKQSNRIKKEELKLKNKQEKITEKRSLDRLIAEKNSYFNNIIESNFKKQSRKVKLKHIKNNT